MTISTLSGKGISGFQDRQPTAGMLSHSRGREAPWPPRCAHVLFWRSSSASRAGRSAAAAPDILDKSYTITAEVEIPVRLLLQRQARLHRPLLMLICEGPRLCTCPSGCHLPQLVAKWYPGFAPEAGVLYQSVSVEYDPRGGDPAKMIKLIAVAFALVAATSAHAMSPAPLHQPDGMITQVREACGVGRVRINGICVARTTRRHVRRAARRDIRHLRREARRCARWSGGTCAQYQ